MNKLNYILVLVGLLSMNWVDAKENIDHGNVGLSNVESLVKTINNDCSPATAQTELNINNVRTTLLTGGDLWWDLDAAKYEVPKVDPNSGELSRHSLFAGALWIGGFDQLGQLKVAAQTYRQTGNDFFPGPLNEDGSISSSECSRFDQFFEVKGSDIDAYLAAFESSESGVLSIGEIPESILNWPGKNNPHFTDFSLPLDKNLAPFYNNPDSGSEDYEPEFGDFPVIDPANDNPVYADQMIWWVFNDAGNNHSESGGQKIGLEVSALAFSFTSNDEINDMTFYKYVVDNKSTSQLDSVYFGQWVDPDLGDFEDDFVGCVVEEGLGVVYNGDANDDGATGYGTDIPMLGVDFFKGPDDQNGEPLGMSAFVYYNNDFSVQGNPETADHFYGYLAGVWKNKVPFTFGENGFTGTTPTDYMFPSDPSIPAGEGVWSECSEGIIPADRRFLQVSGPFKLLPGAVNDVIIGVVWVRGGIEYPCPSFDALLRADQKAQALFDNNFKPLDGPDAPQIAIRELDQELILTLSNPTTSNNVNESYTEPDPILAGINIADSLYKFQGYRVYQLRGSTVSANDFSNPDLAREIFTVDIAEDGITKIVNFEADSEVGFEVPVLKVNGNDNGIRHTFQITEDQFALGDKKLVNHKPYYFSAVAFGHNNHTVFDPNNPQAPNTQKIPYLAGRKNIKTYTGVPHNPQPQNGGMMTNASYGDGPEITVIRGKGNGGHVLELTPETKTEILANGFAQNRTYMKGFGPLEISVFDPFSLPEGDFELEISNSSYEIIEGPFHGTLAVNQDGTITYTGGSTDAVDYFLYRLTDYLGNSDIGSVVIQTGSLLLPGEVVSVPETYDQFDSAATVEVELELGKNIFTIASDFGLVNVEEPLNGEIVTITTGDTGFDYVYNPDFRGIEEIHYTFNIPSQPSWGLFKGVVYVYIKDEPTEPRVIDDFAAIDVDATVVLNLYDNDVLFSNYETSEAIADEDFNSPIISPLSTWELRQTQTDGSVRTFKGQRNISIANEQAIGGWELDLDCVDNAEIACYEIAEPLGFTVNIDQIRPSSKRDNTLGESSSVLNFANVTAPWLSFIEDADGVEGTNWNLSGGTVDDITHMSASDSSPGVWNDHSLDDEENYERAFFDGGIAPYCVVQTFGDIGLREGTSSFVPFQVLPMSPGCSDCYPGSTEITNTLDEIFSFDVIITDDQSLWSECVVIENCRFPEAAIGNAPKSGLRLSPSKNENGNEIDGSVGKSYFPGYAVNVETGERVNIMFAENSRMGQENGADMLWNPSETIETEVSGTGSYKFGGEHYVYVMNSAYDGCTVYHEKLSTMESNGNPDIDLKRSVYDEAIWVIAPVLESEFGQEPQPITVTNENGVTTYDISNPAEMNIRVGMPYNESVIDETLLYRFDFNDQVPEINNETLASEALESVQVVPNPYYAYSQYENSKFDNKVKITNLPDQAEIRIFTLDGTIIRNLSVDNSGIEQGTALSNKNGTFENSVEWDLKNNAAVPIASGMYIIHVESLATGEEKILKWFGVMRPIELDAF